MCGGNALSTVMYVISLQGTTLVHMMYEGMGVYIYLFIEGILISSINYYKIIYFNSSEIIYLVHVCACTVVHFTKIYF